MRLSRLGAVLFAAALSSVPVSAQASSLSLGDVLNEFNLVVFGSMTSTSEVEGRTLVGGSLSGASVYFTRGNLVPTGMPVSSFDALTVGGSLGNGFQSINNGGTLAVGGGAVQANLNGGGSARVGGTAFQVQGGPVSQGVPGLAASIAADVADIKQTSLDGSQALKALGGVAAGVSGNKAQFNAAPDASGLTVYDIDIAFFNTVNELEFALNGANTVIVNVSGLGATLQDNMPGFNSAFADNIIWNFHEATNLRFERQFWGSVLAPLAAVTNTTPIEGTLIANSYTQQGEMHYQGFEGTIPTADVPLPSGLPLALTAFALLGYVSLRRRNG